MESGQEAKLGPKKAKNVAKGGIHELVPGFGWKDFTITCDITRFQKIHDPLIVVTVNKFCRVTPVKRRGTTGSFKILHKL